MNTNTPQSRIQIHFENLADYFIIYTINERAFGRPDEAILVDKLRARLGRREDDWLSLVAESDGQVVGHILFTPARLVLDGGGEVHGMGLAPLAVLPEYQGQGVGAALSEGGLEILRQRGCTFVIVLGHPDYYPRFGFRPASQFGIRSQWPGVPDAAFMALILDEAVLAKAEGIAWYQPEFDEVT